MTEDDDRYYLDYWLSDGERVSRDGTERYIVAIRDSLDPLGWVYRFEAFDRYVVSILRNMNRR